MKTTERNKDADGRRTPPPCSEDSVPFDVAEDVVCEARLELLHVMEEMGAVVTHLREAVDACYTKNMGAIRCDVEDAADCLNRIESESSRIAADLHKWLSIPQNASGHPPRPKLKS